jgi:fructose-1,6-bisphosphatase I
LLFELQPMAFIVEQAGGLATDGKDDILSLKVTSVNQRSPVYIGSAAEVTMAGQFLSQ